MVVANVAYWPIGVVDAEAGAHDSLLGQPQRQPKHAAQKPCGRDRPANRAGAAVTSRASGLHFVVTAALVNAIRRGIRVHDCQVAVLLRVGRKELVAHAVVQREIRPHAPVVLGVERHRRCRAGNSWRWRSRWWSPAACQAENPPARSRCRAPREIEGSGGVRAAQKIAMHAAIVAAKAHVVLAVNPAQCLGDRDCLRKGKAGLLLVESR